MTIIRQVKIRQILGSAALALATAWALLLLTHALQVPARAADRVVRIGYQKYGNFILSMIFGTLFLADGLLQCASAYMVRYRRWRLALTWVRSRRSSTGRWPQ